MARKSKPKKMTMEEAKLEIWSYCIEKGWQRLEQPGNMNCLYDISDTKERMRLHFKDEILSLEVKRLLTKTEKKGLPNKNAKWVVLDQAPYSSVEIGQGGLIFHDEKKEKSGNAKGKE